VDLTGSALRIEDAGLPARTVGWSSRIGIRVGVDHQWRCYDPLSAAVSRLKPPDGGTKAR
jgi:3-methyladenine DNA glycosylase Mpg